VVGERDSISLLPIAQLLCRPKAGRRMLLLFHAPPPSFLPELRSTMLFTQEKH
jgi:hypothetical protein